VFWDITQRSPLKVTRISEEYFASIFRIENKGNEETNIKQVSRRGLCLIPTSCCILVKFILLTWRWKRYVPPKLQLTFNGLYGVISTAVRTSDHTFPNLFFLCVFQLRATRSSSRKKEFLQFFKASWMFPPYAHLIIFSNSHPADSFSYVRFFYCPSDFFCFPYSPCQLSSFSTKFLYGLFQTNLARNKTFMGLAIKTQDD
jgi:hypothetical protein